MTLGKSPNYREAYSVHMLSGNTTGTLLKVFMLITCKILGTNKVLIHATTWMSLENIMLSERHKS